MRIVRALVLAAAAATFGAASSRAGIPLPQWSTIDRRLVLCPAGDIAFHVTARRFDVPTAGGRLVVDFCGSTGWAFDPADQPASISFVSAPCYPSVFADASGLATFALRAGGTTADSTVALYVDGVQFGHRTLASPDLNGDLVVNAADVAAFDARLGTTDEAADYDADGVVTANDRTILLAHLGHAAAQPTPTVPRSWGRLKIAYR